METLILTVVATIIAAIIIGLPTLAFRHPDFYNDFIGSKPYYVLGFSYVAYVAFVVGVSITIKAINDSALTTSNEAIVEIVSYSDSTALAIANFLAAITYFYLSVLIGGILRRHEFKQIRMSNNEVK